MVRAGVVVVLKPVGVVVVLKTAVDVAFDNESGVGVDWREVVFCVVVLCLRVVVRLKVECDTGDDRDDLEDGCELLGASEKVEVAKGVVEVVVKEVDEVAEEGICIDDASPVEELCDGGINEEVVDFLLDLGEG